MVGTSRQRCAFYSEEKPVIANLIVDSAAHKILLDFFDKGVQQSALVDGVYEAKGLFPELRGKGRWLLYSDFLQYFYNLQKKGLF